MRFINCNAFAKFINLCTHFYIKFYLLFSEMIMNTTNKIYELRLQTGLNRKDFSAKVGIPYMTLTDWELGKHDAPEYVYRLLEYYIKLNGLLINDSVSNLQINNINNYFSNPSECHIWEEQDNYVTNFPVVETHSIVPVKNIYPLKQKDAIRIHDALCDDNRVNNIILFGSSVTMRCNKNSDLDLSVRLYPDYINNSVKNEVSEKIQSICDWNADIIWFDRIKNPSRLYNNILKGVQIL